MEKRKGVKDKKSLMREINEINEEKNEKKNSKIAEINQKQKIASLPFKAINQKPKITSLPFKTIYKKSTSFLNKTINKKQNLVDYNFPKKINEIWYEDPLVINQNHFICNNSCKLYLFYYDINNNTLKAIDNMNFENSIKLFLSTMENKIFINIVLTSLYIMDYIIESGKIKLNKNKII